MKLSVIIVNYNVKHFLEQCLNSVLSAAVHCETEIFVVDNNSVDGSCAMVREKFPEVILIENSKNYGFSYANNQAIKRSKGKYILLLNPDTVIEEKTFSEVTAFMDSNPDAGGVGVKMIDGKGKYLPESKRGLPTPRVAFYKIFGLAKLFPKSKSFGKYHLSYLDKNKIHKIDVLSGACMFLRKEALEKTGLLDENFFMYGEDIDISYRITKAGYNNYYFPNTTIIHYKGESTKKGSINYVIVFYNAMIIFAKKHFSQKHAKNFIALINFAIYFRASLAIFYRFVRTIVTPIIDVLIILLGFLIITPLWSEFKFGDAYAYPQTIFLYSILSYALIWMISLFFSGAYDKPVKLKKVFQGVITGTLIILIIYSLLPENLRTSRALILLGSLWSLFLIPTIRYLLHFTRRESFKISLPGKKRVVIVGNKKEAKNLARLIDSNSANIKIAGFVDPENEAGDSFFTGKLNQMDEIIKINKIDEIIFCAKSLQTQQIIRTMLNLNDYKVEYKISSQDGAALIGSNAINAFGDLYDININSIAKPINTRNKRLIDFLVAMFFLITSPVLLFMVNKPKTFIVNILNVFIGTKTFVSFTEGINKDMLPVIKPGILSPLSIVNKENIKNDLIEKINFIYAKNYRIFTDLNIIFKSWRKIGQ